MISRAKILSMQAQLNAALAEVAELKHAAALLEIDKLKKQVADLQAEVADAKPAEPLEGG